jgi:hypothetical protein
VGVAKHLHFDVARAGDVDLQQHAIIAEGGARLALAGGQGGVEVACAIDPAHALAAAAGYGLDEHREPDALCLRSQRRARLVLAEIARGHRHPGLLHQRFGGVLQAHGADRRRRRADPHQAGCQNRLGEVGVLGQEPVSRVNRSGACRRGGGENFRLIEIAVAGGGRTDADGLVRLTHERQARVAIRVNRDGADTHSPGGADNPPSDLSAVGDQQAFDHRRHIRNTPNRARSGMGAFRVALKARPRTSRVWAGSMTPSSHSLAVAK